MNYSKPFDNFFKNKTVFVTGHTGFIGTWLSTWLVNLGANVVGYSLPPPTHPSMFEIISLQNKIKDIRGDIRNHDSLEQALNDCKAEIVIHLAAQPLVLQSYEKPIETIDTNVLGTVYLLESIRKTPSVKVCINFTTDKCYENINSNFHKEDDPMGGSDPYSVSKGASELLTASYRRSFFSGVDNHTSVSTIRAGNVIGGGDWAENRVLPDCIRSLMLNQKINIRNPNAIRPWQYVLEPISGILLLCYKMYKDPDHYNEAWNFGPNDSKITVEDLVRNTIKEWGNGTWQDISQDTDKNLESKILQLDCTKAKTRLGWNAVYSTSEAIHQTISWYRVFAQRKVDMFDFTIKQIENYVDAAKRKELYWAYSLKTYD